MFFFFFDQQDCLNEELDFRSQQCAAYNDEKYENRTIEWEPVESSSLQEMCSLVCRVKHHNFTKMLAPKVLDGTRCNKFTKDMCIAGKCEVSIHHLISFVCKLQDAVYVNVPVYKMSNLMAYKNYLIEEDTTFHMGIELDTRMISMQKSVS